MYLFLDDLRNPGDVTWILLPHYNDWIIVRSYDAAIKHVIEHGWPTFISFDHDLGDVEFVDNEKSGYTFANWLVEYSLDGNTMPVDFKFTVHSKNPIGAKKITSLLENYMKYVRQS